MADILFDDDDDDLWIEDPYAEADDLAEHTMHSPVLVNYDPAFESNDILTDWDCYSDDYFDFESPKLKRRKIEERAPSKSKRKIPKSMKNLPELFLGDPASSDEETNARARSTVIWKTSGDSPTLPVVKDGQEEKVSILKDWRERFKPSLRNSDIKPARSDGSQRAVAVVIQQMSLTDRSVNGAGAAPPSRSEKERRHGLHDDPGSDLSHRGGAASTHTNGPVQKRSKRVTSTSAEPHEPVPANGVTSTKRKRQSNEAAEEPAPPKKTRARRESQLMSGQKPSDTGVNGTAAQESIDEGEERQPTGRLTRKRKLSPTHDSPEPEPVSKKNRLQPSDGKVKRGSSRAKPTAAAAAAVGRRSTRRK